MDVLGKELGNSGKLVTVGRLLNPMQAQMAKGMLESSGIPCFLQGENANHMVPLAFVFACRCVRRMRRSRDSISAAQATSPPTTTW